MAAVLITNAPVAMSGTPAALFTAPYPKAVVVYVTAVGGAITVGDANVSATRGIAVASGTTYAISFPGQIISPEQLFAQGAGSAQVSYLRVVSQ